MFNRVTRFFISALTLVVVITGCGAGPGNGSSPGPSTSIPIVPSATNLQMVDDNSFNALSEDDRVYIAKKIFTTLYKGYDINTVTNKVQTGRFISSLKATLANTEVPQPNLDKVYQDTYSIPYDGRQGDRLFEKRWRIFSHVASTLYYTELSRSYYNEWIAYILSQTIFFSPAYEVESVQQFPELVASNYELLKRGLDQNHSLEDMVFDHMVSETNWARFRSPEDNAREMLEIWLYDYDDSHVPPAAKALQNWRWVLAREKNEQGIYGNIYKFFNDTNNAENQNNEAVDLLGTEIRTGTDFYRAVVNHPDFVPTVVDRLVNLFFPTLPSREKQDISQKIADSNPKTFQQIFTQILFSKKFLLSSDRLKSIEEIFMGLAHVLDLEPSGNTFRRLFTDGMKNSNQLAFTYKLGRPDEGVSDSDSVIRLHQYIRENVFLNRRGDGWDSTMLRERYGNAETPRDFLNNMFLDVVGRKMTQDESSELVSIIEQAGVDDVSRPWNQFAVILLGFDYFSRLSEIYTYRKIESGDAS